MIFSHRQSKQGISSHSCSSPKMPVLAPQHLRPSQHIQACPFAKVKQNIISPVRPKKFSGYKEIQTNTNISSNSEHTLDIYIYIYVNYFHIGDTQCEISSSFTNLPFSGLDSLPYSSMKRAQRSARCTSVMRDSAPGNIRAEANISTDINCFKSSRFPNLTRKVYIS